MDLSLKHEKLPKALRDRQTPFDHYLLVRRGCGVGSVGWGGVGSWRVDRGQWGVSAAAAAAAARVVPLHADELRSLPQKLTPLSPRLTPARPRSPWCSW
jgi:hypothetical protein